jgi:hypothetical protein
MGEDEHVEGVEAALARKRLVGDVGVRDAELIERVANPSFVLRLEPRVYERDARWAHVVRAHGRRARNGDAR